MSNTWKRPPRKDVWQDLQALALWMLIIGVAGYLIFPNFFKDIYSRFSEPVTQASSVNTDSQLNSNLENTFQNLGSYNTQTLLGQDLPGNSGNTQSGNNTISSGYWVIYVTNGGFKQFAVSSDGYGYILRMIQNDENTQGTNMVILASNGQIGKYAVSNEIYTVINDLSVIMARSNK